VRGPLVMAGYHNDPAATAEAFAHGWHHTGDLGYLDEDGYLYVTGRAKDMIITGGFNVYAAEVERAVMGHAAVRECAVIGVPDPKWGERVTAVVELRSGAIATPDELIPFAKHRIGSVKAPKHIAIWPQLPRTPVGKIAKTAIRTGSRGR
jgi:fatty-acyl-CoA synthase